MLFVTQVGTFWAKALIDSAAATIVASDLDLDLYDAICVLLWLVGIGFHKSLDEKLKLLAVRVGLKFRLAVVVVDVVVDVVIGAVSVGRAGRRGSFGCPLRCRRRQLRRRPPGARRIV